MFIFSVFFAGLKSGFISLSHPYGVRIFFQPFQVSTLKEFIF